MNRHSAPRVFFYVQHLLGIGHQARAAAITRAMCRQGLDVIYVSGGLAEISFNLGGATVVQLPPARAADATFGTLLDADGKLVDVAWEAARCDTLLDAFERAQPDALLIESFPFGRRRFRFELLPLLEKVAGLVPVAASVRDILVTKDDPKRTQWVVDTVNAFFDTVIVHGDPRVITLDVTFPGADAIGDLVRYSGYVASETKLDTESRRAGVVVSAGGGAVGGSLLRASLASRPFSRLSRAPWRLITGPNLPKSDKMMLKKTRGVTIETYVENFNEILSNAAVSVSQAGYNTVMDLMVSRTKSVLVPFSQYGETEQSVRAALLARRGLFQVLPEGDLTPNSLGQAIDAAYDGPAPHPSGMDLDGAATTARIMSELATGRPNSGRL
ncbi:MAG: glycosyl transferase [Rhodospirillaceae bacterium]|nr:glycosyl transferase [Rhodospirillaceae bacterium]